MDFVAWCDFVLSTIIQVEKSSPDIREGGVSQAVVARELLGLPSTCRYEQWPDAAGETMKDAIFIAGLNLAQIGCFDSPYTNFYMKVSQRGREHGADPTPLWENICRKQLDIDQQHLLQIVNHLSPQEGPKFVLPRWVGREALMAEWTGNPKLLSPVAGELARLDLVQHLSLGDGLTLRPTYSGMVWETRRMNVAESKFIDGLVTEWETTTVEFKQELAIDTNDRKVEFIKDVIGLANTQASGRRWLIVGFEDKGHTYYGPPDTGLYQNRIEQVLARYTAPSIAVRYEVVNYRGGPVGKLEVLREAAKLPYSVAKSLGDKSAGDKKRIVEGQIFVRHGSQTEQPTEAELQAIKEEAERARSQGGG